jgi:hypothetical protein
MIACITRLLGGRYIVYNSAVEIEGLWIIESNYIQLPYIYLSVEEIAWTVRTNNYTTCNK